MQGFTLIFVVYVGFLPQCSYFATGKIKAELGVPIWEKSGTYSSISNYFSKLQTTFWAIWRLYWNKAEVAVLVLGKEDLSDVEVWIYK